MEKLDTSLLKRAGTLIIAVFVQPLLWVLFVLFYVFSVLPSFLSFVAYGGIEELWQIMHAVWSVGVWVEASAITAPVCSVVFGYYSYRLGGHCHLPSLKLAAASFILQSIAAVPLFPLTWKLDSYLSDVYYDYVMQAVQGNPSPTLPPDCYQQTMALINPMVACAAVVTVCGLVFSISLAKGFSGMRKRIKRREFRICTWLAIAGMFASGLAATVLIGSSSTGLSAVFSAIIWLAIVGALNALSTIVGMFIFGFGLDAYARQEEKKTRKVPAEWPSDVVSDAGQVRPEDECYLPRRKGLP